MTNRNAVNQTLTQLSALHAHLDGDNAQRFRNKIEILAQLIKPLRYKITTGI